MALPLVAGLVLVTSACDADPGTAPARTATPAPTPTPAPTAPNGGTMDEETTTSGQPSDATGGTAAVLGAGAVLTQDDSGTTLRLSPGESAVLRLTPPLQDTTPRVADAEVVELVPVQHFADPGYAEYELLALAPGRTTVTVEGEDPVEVTVLVVAPGR